ncbi:hypothetical protein M3649_16900 [Ureibacillus chungkukjangi]|uniref:hypothetical protein n=1 Tax=Ureibacillus chungkukjangi TaxID=1202712 RepID=UPI00203B14DF|nr:hypothetical protein [Ureibacillus chungkukjangi]MCM3389800.1 hypothetical protein [Ureibacillus chungkukjangi]
MKYYKLLDNNIERAAKGREVWLNKLNALDINIDDTFILILNNESEFNYYALLYLNNIAKQNKAHLLTTDVNVYKAYTYFTDSIDSCLFLSEDEAQAILSFYNLYMFTDKLFILSSTYPNGRTGYNLFLNGKIDIEEFISVGIYRNEEFLPEHLVEYHGDDLELIEFFNITREEEAF